MMKISVGIIGVTGYTGGELLRLLVNHSEAVVKKASSRSNQGNDVVNVHPYLMHNISLIEEELDVEEFQKDLDVIFLALPHGLSANIVQKLDLNKVKVIDLGADFRLKDPESYKFWYELDHSCPSLLNDAVYGLPELYKKEIKESKLIANPGCYPTSVLLGLAPLLKNGLIKLENIIIDSKSGVTGAGKTLTQQSHYPEINDNLLAYKVGNHRHVAEIQQELGFLAKKDIKVIFTPHLIPMNRGILSTIYTDLIKNITQEELEELYQEFYQESPFVRVRNKNLLPQTKWVQGSNYCDIAPVLDQRTNKIIVISAIDNLVKGASGQAIQNMNLMFGLDETSGLKFAPMYP